MGSVASTDHLEGLSDSLLAEDKPSDPENEFWTDLWRNVEQVRAEDIYETLKPSTGTGQRCGVCN